MLHSTRSLSPGQFGSTLQQFLIFADFSIPHVYVFKVVNLEMSCLGGCGVNTEDGVGDAAQTHAGGACCRCVPAAPVLGCGSLCAYMHVCVHTEPFAECMRRRILTTLLIQLTTNTCTTIPRPFIEPSLLTDSVLSNSRFGWNCLRQLLHCCPCSKNRPPSLPSTCNPRPGSTRFSED